MDDYVSPKCSKHPPRGAAGMSVIAMAATGHSSWADLNSELLMSIAAAVAVEGSSLFYYVCLRGVCAAWCSALPPPYPCLLSLDDDRARSASVFSFPIRRSFRLYTAVDGCFDVREFPSHARVVGSGNGRLAVAIDSGSSDHDHLYPYVSCWTVKLFVLDPRSGHVDELLPPRNPRTDRVEDPEYGVRKLLFTPDPDDATVVVMCGRAKIAYVDISKISRSRRKCDLVWTMVDVVSATAKHLVDLAFDATGGKVYCLDSYGDVHVLCIPHHGRNSQEALTEPSLLSAAFTPPKLTSPKHLFFCHGSLYQVWQNDSCTVSSPSGFRMSADEIFVLRYDPARQSWDLVKDLGGCSVFISKNNTPAVVRAGTVPGVRGDCLYWIDWLRVPMVCDVTTGTSKPCFFPGGACKGNCWYFGDDNMTSDNRLRY